MLIGGIVVAGAIMQENHELMLEEEEYEELSAELKISDPDEVEEEPADKLESEFPPEDGMSEEAELPDESEETEDADPDMDQFFYAPEELLSEDPTEETYPSKPASPGKPAPDTSTPQTAPTGYTGANLSACKAKNGEFIAWLKIPGTKVDYPVVLTDRVDYYLDHNFSGKQSKLGTLFSLAKTDYKTPGQNIAIYGHHITNTSSGQKMFRPLFSYKQKSFYDKHSIVYLDTLYHCGKYRIFAVINYVNGDWDPSTASFANDDTFMEFVTTAKSLSLYDTGVSVCATDHILTLITCDRTFASKEGRLVVMAVEE